MVVCLAYRHSLGIIILVAMKEKRLPFTVKTNQLNPLNPNGEQHQFSPNNIHTLSRDKVMRINETITKGKML